jgi:hypothetical protein
VKPALTSTTLANRQTLLPEELQMSITLRNQTGYTAQFIVTKGEQIIARIPGVEPKAQMTIPTDETFEVFATAVIDGNTYNSAPQIVKGATGFKAQVLQVREQGTYEFHVAMQPSKKPNSLDFQKTCLSSVIFTITKDSKPLQNVVVDDTTSLVSIDISDTFYVYAVINGVTTAVSKFVNPSATVTAVTDSSDLDYGYYTLQIN